MNLGAFRSSVRWQVDLRRHHGASPDAIIDRFVNEGVRQVLLKTRCYMQIGDMTLSNGINEYRLDANILAIDQLYNTVGGSEYFWTKIPADELIRFRRGIGNSPSRYFSVLGHDLLLVYPTPTGTETVRFYYVGKPAEMTSAAHDPATVTYGGVPTEFHNAIEFYALWKAALYSRARANSANEKRLLSEQAVEYQAQFEKTCVDVRKQIRRKSTAKVLGPKLGGRRMSIPHDHSRYP